MKTASYLSEIESAVSALSKRGGVIAVPTDTTYGLICNLQDSEAVDRIYEIKGRDRSKPLIILGAQADSLLGFMAKESTAARLLAEKFWPGALTIVAESADVVPRGILSGGSTVGLRQPNHVVLLDLLSRLPQLAVASTSANLSGAGFPTSLQEVLDTVGELVDYVMPDCGQNPAGNESTIVNVSQTPAKILRAGALSQEQIQACLKTS